MLSGVLADFLEQLIQLASPYRFTRKRPRDLGKEIEETILGGSVHIKQVGGNQLSHLYLPSEGVE